jgi:hypothetical protein
MEINWERYKQIILNDRAIWYKPDSETIKKLSKLFPDLNVFGFGRYQETQCWYILASSDKFPENHLGSRIVVPIQDVMIWAKPSLYLVSRLINLVTPT